MDKSELAKHKRAAKYLATMPAFKQAKKGRLAAPYDRFKSKRLQMTDITDVSDSHAVVFFWKTGEILTDTAFYAHLLFRTADGRMTPLLEFHWHPSHKGFHCVTPCRSPQDYTARMLSGPVRELAMRTDPTVDPREEAGRARLVKVFCDACNIRMGFIKDAPQKDLWS